MSLTISPTTGKLVKVGSDEFADLLRSPTWGSHFTTPLPSITVGRATVVHGLPPSPNGRLPSLPVLSRSPVLSPMPDMPRSSGVQNTQYRTMTGLPPLNLGSSAVSGGYVGVPVQSYNGYNGLNLTPMPPMPRSSSVQTRTITRPVTRTPIQLPFIHTGSTLLTPITSLPPVPTSPTGSLSLQPVVNSYLMNHATNHMSPMSPMASLPPVPSSRWSNTTNHSRPMSPMASLPPVPSSPRMSWSNSTNHTPNHGMNHMSPMTPMRSMSPVRSMSPMASLPPVPSSPLMSWINTTNHNTNHGMKPMTSLPPVPRSPRY